MKNKKEILKSVKHDVECLNINMNKDANKYHYDLIIGNLEDLLK